MFLLDNGVRDSHDFDLEAQEMKDQSLVVSHVSTSAGSDDSLPGFHESSLALDLSSDHSTTRSPIDASLDQDPALTASQ